MDYFHSMVTNKKLSIYLLFLLSLIVRQSTCKRTLDCTGNRFVFLVPNLSASANSDTVSIGDTIWFAFECPTSLKDEISGTTINYSDAANVGTALSISSFNPVEFGTPAAQRFQVKVANGTLLPNRNPALVFEFGFAEVTNKYKLLVGLIPKLSGKYALLFSKADGVYRRGHECTKATFELSFSSDQHRYLNPNPITDPVERSRDFYFVVR
jgi:hypothetical protein